MTNKKDRKKSDVPGDATRSFFSDALKDFANPLFEVPSPHDELWLSDHLEEDHDRWDPNNPALFEDERSSAWLMETWFLHVRPRCKKALDKWNKETGGGDGTPAAFIDFCSNDKWLVWTFLHDYDANFLVANNASGGVPNHSQLEAGFDTAGSHISELADETSSKGTSSDKLRSVEQQLADIKQENQSWNGLTAVISDCFKSKSAGTSESGSGSTLTPAKLSHDDCLKKAN